MSCLKLLEIIYKTENSNHYDIKIEYALGGLSNNIFVSKHQIYLPDRKGLKVQLEKALYENNS